MAHSIHIRTNGRANAWPVFIGENHPFYSKQGQHDLANASFSLFNIKNTDFNLKQIEWEVVVDAGHGTAETILHHENRIPETIVLTHPHLDHSLGIDWIAQSYYFKHNKEKQYPFYATRPCFEAVLQMYPHLKKILCFQELIPGQIKKIKECKGLQVIAFPVFHGESAFGASMLFFEADTGHGIKRILFTGDMLCPLLREIDYEIISKAEVVYIDSNNRFPYPRSNHQSIVGYDPGETGISKYVKTWEQKDLLAYFMAPHNVFKYGETYHNYFNEILAEHPKEYCYAVFDFIKRTTIPNVMMVHYGGLEDKKIHKQEVFSANELLEWTEMEAAKVDLTSNFHLPGKGEIYSLS